MNADAKTEIVNVRVTREVRAILKRRADAVAGGRVSVVLNRLISNAMKQWRTEAANSEEQA